jgi:hypothetical protein
MVGKQTVAAMVRLLLIVLTVHASSIVQSAYGQGLDAVVKREVERGRYMSNAAECKPATADILGWSASMLTECIYRVADTVEPRSKKTGLVFLANASPERIQKWLNASCQRAMPTKIEDCIRNSVSAIRLASGAQFPVSGLVWEDMEGDGIQKGYVFRNGVTIRIAEFSNGSASVPDLELLRAIASPTTTIKGMRRDGGFARIISTTRKDYARFSGRSDIPTGRGDGAAAVSWSNIVGEVYRSSLNSDENPLITASICARAGWPIGCRTRP